MDYAKLLRGLVKSQSRAPSTLSGQVAAALKSHRLPTAWILATGDATAIAAETEIAGAAFARLPIDPLKVDTDSHTFARPGDEAALFTAVLNAIERLST